MMKKSQAHSGINVQNEQSERKRSLYFYLCSSGESAPLPVAWLSWPRKWSGCMMSPSSSTWKEHILEMGSVSPRDQQLHLQSNSIIDLGNSKWLVKTEFLAHMREETDAISGLHSGPGFSYCSHLKNEPVIRRLFAYSLYLSCYFSNT